MVIQQEEEGRDKNINHHQKEGEENQVRGNAEKEREENKEKAQYIQIVLLWLAGNELRERADQEFC